MIPYAVAKEVTGRSEVLKKMTSPKEDRPKKTLVDTAP
jgi:hypothetical protein